MNPCLLYVGTADGVFVLRWDGGGEPDLIGRGIEGNAVRGIAVHPHDPAAAYISCALRGWGLYHTRNAGRSFESRGFADHWVWDVVFHPADPRTIYVGTEPPMLYVSDDDGRTFHPREGINGLPGRTDWHFFHPPFRDQPMRSGHIHGIAVHPGRPRRIVAGVEQGGVILSEDGGETWEETLSGCDIHRMAVDPADPDRIYAGAGEGLYISEDAGRTWSRAPIDGYMHAIRFDPRDPSRIYLFTDGHPPLARSENRGAEWSPIGHGLPGAGPADSLDIHPSHPDVLFYGCEPSPRLGQLFVSLNRGDFWQPLPVELPKIWRLRAAPTIEGRLSV